MFGYLVANNALLTDEQRRRYQSLYCGLCRALRARHGQVAGVALTYDMTFLILLLGSVYGGDETCGAGRCLPHPLTPRPYCAAPFTDYAADLNAALAYYHLLDDWRDDHNPLARAGAGVLRPCLGRVEQALPRQCAAIRTGLAQLGELEQRGGGVDDCCRAFGGLMAELFVPDPKDGRAPLLRRLGDGLGQFIYLMDAVLDKPEDLKRRRFNPLVCLPDMDWRPVLADLLSGCTDAFDQLSPQRDRALLENILYSGLWVKYLAAHPNAQTEGESV